MADLKTEVGGVSSYVTASIRPLVGNGHVRARDDNAKPLRSASWLDARVVFDHRHWRCTEAEVRWTAPHHLILLTEQGRTSRTRVECDGRQIYEGRDRAGVLTFVPAFTERRGIYRDADLVYSALWVDPKLQHGWAGRETLSGLQAFANHTDPAIAALIRALRADVSAKDLPSQLYIEHLVALILLRIAAMAGKVPPASRAGSLSGKTLARLNDYIDAHLGDDISLTDLAREVNMSTDAFSRRFKASTGVPPYAYVLERRVARAENLLSTSRSSLISIALTLGFSSQSHFTNVFRRLRGVTPSVYRAQISPES